MDIVWIACVWIRTVAAMGTERQKQKVDLTKNVTKRPVRIALNRVAPNTHIISVRR